MSDVIEFMDWIDLQKSLNLINEQVSGMTSAEAEAALGAFKNSNLYIANTNTTIAGSSVINFPGTTAAEAAGEYIAGGGATSASGAAIGTTGDAVGTANIAIGQTTIGQVATKVYGLLSMPLPTVAAALAPLAGATLGVGLYESNPELWTKISQTLLPFCYDDNELMPVMADENGNTYYSKEAIDAMAQILQSVASSSGENFTANTTITAKPHTASEYIAYGGMYAIIVNKALEMHPSMVTSPTATFFINSDFEGDRIYFTFHNRNVDVDVKLYDIIENGASANANSYFIGSKNGNDGIYLKKDGTWGGFSGGGQTNLTKIYAYSDAFNYLGKIFGSGILTINGELHNIYPTGINNWNGDTYPDTVTPINILTGYDEEGKPIYTPYYPVSTPIGDPGVSNDPAVNPNPAVNPDPAPVINPVISPVPNPNLYPDTVPVPEPAPVPNPVPEPQPVPEPDIDPSEDTDTKPDKDPTTPKDPTDGGITPTPIIPTIPTLPSAATGLLHVYNPTQSQIDAFGSWLWTTFSGDLIDTLSKLFNDPMDAVIGLHELYATPAISGGATIRCGYLDSGINANLIGSRYTTINCGSVVVEEYYQNYLDYSPYTSCFIYLPFVGIVPVSSDDIIGNAVNVTYHIDSYTGCCIAVVTVAKSGYSSTVYQFEGNCAVEIPISSGYQSSLMSGLLAVAGTAITSSPAIGMTAAHMGRAGLGKNTVQHSGSFGSSYGAMGNKVPYIIVKRPVQKKVYNYSKSYGFPAHKMVYVGNCQGYLRAKEVRVTSTTATNVEKDMIVNALTSGVYVK